MQLKDYDSLKAFLKKKEDYRTAVYDDKTGMAPATPGVFKGNPTIGIGFNLYASGADKICAQIGVSRDDLIQGRAALNDDQIDKAFKICVDDALKDIERKLGEAVFNELHELQQMVVVSLVFNLPALLGPNLSRYIKEGVKSGNFDAARDEIKYRSNLQRDSSVQKRRDAEAHYFERGALTRQLEKTNAEIARLRASTGQLNREADEFSRMSREAQQTFERERQEIIDAARRKVEMEYAAKEARRRECENEIRLINEQLRLLEIARVIYAVVGVATHDGTQTIVGTPLSNSTPGDCSRSIALIDQKIADLLLRLQQINYYLETGVDQVGFSHQATLRM